VNRVRVLFLTHRLPYAANRGDRLRALQILKLLKSRGEVDLVSFVHNRYEWQRATDLANAATTVTPVPLSRMLGYARAVLALRTEYPLTHAILNSHELRAVIARVIERHPPDLVIAYCSGMARFALEEPLKSIPLVIDMVDVDSEKWRALGQTATAPVRWIYAAEGRRLADFEARAARAARAVIVVNQRERSALKRLASTANVQVVENGVDVANLRPNDAPSADPLVTFCGVMDYWPNEEGALWFAKSVWPMVRSRRPAARLCLVGSDPRAVVRDLASADPSIEVTGTVPDVRPYLWRSAVGIAPISIARGVQNKVLEAVAAGLPCVITLEVEQGLPPEVLPACLAASDAEGFADAIISLLDRTPGERRAMAARANLEVLAWSDRLAPLGAILDAALLPSGA
jgi:sugar transferase (PEP-CTERM/EpsH1 system associated)